MIRECCVYILEKVVKLSKTHNFRLRIQASYSTLSNGEKRVADYLLGSTNAAGFLSISAIAAASEVSDATVTRFTKRLGYKGFIDFKRHLISDISSVSKNHGQFFSGALSADVGSAINDFAQVLCTSIIETLSSTPADAFFEAASIISNAHRVELYAHGGSGYIAENAVFKFLRLGISCTARTDSYTQGEYASLLTEQDVAIALSHTGETKSVLNAMETARALGATTIAITSYENSSIARLAEHFLKTVAPELPIGSEAGVTRVAQIALLDALAVTAVQFNNQDNTDQSNSSSTRAGQDRPIG